MIKTMITNKQRKELKEEWLNWYDLRYIKSKGLRSDTVELFNKKKRTYKNFFINNEWKIENY